MTLDRVVLAGKPRPEPLPSSIDDYTAIDVKRRISDRSIHITVGTFTQDRHGNYV
jgi:hypothetical protein